MTSAFSWQNSEPLPCFILYSKAKFACYSRCFLTSYFCILLLLLLSRFSRAWLSLCDPIDGSQPGSPIPGILQARTLGNKKLMWFTLTFALLQWPGTKSVVSPRMSVMVHLMHLINLLASVPYSFFLCFRLDNFKWNYQIGWFFFLPNSSVWIPLVNFSIQFLYFSAPMFLSGSFS